MIRSISRTAAALLPAAALLLAAPRLAAAAPQRFALSMLHFNIQYVAGGLNGFFSKPDPALDRSAEQVEDSIVRESFEPVLDLLAAHPTWGADLELQGYMIDVMADRHPMVLDKLRALAKSGQVEVVSFHYSDQLFMAYPKEDWVRSQKLDRAAFDDHQIPRGTAVFCQEGQAGPGMAGAMAEAGYETLVFPKNLFSFQHGDVMPAPIYQLGDVSMITSRPIEYDDGKTQLSVDWWFVDDGELLATGGVDPYLTETFKKSPAALAKVEADLAAREAAGAQITTVSKYVAAIKAQVTPVAAPPLLDGTWQPNSTDGISRWLGGFGLWWKDERDNDVRSLTAMAHRELLAAETVAAEAGLDASAEIEAGFRLLVLGEVSDASGINPFRGEIEYGLAHATEALRIARDLIGRAREKLGATIVGIDTGAATVVKDPEPDHALPAIDAPIELSVLSGERAHQVSWQEASPTHRVVTVHFDAGDERSVSVGFPGQLGDVVYTPGLSLAPASVPRDAFVFEHFDLALSDGLIGLGGGRFVVEDLARVHVAARITRDEGDVLFHDDTTPAGEEMIWVFHVIDGTVDEAAQVARSLNVTPKVRR